MLRARRTQPVERPQKIGRSQARKRNKISFVAAAAVLTRVQAKKKHALAKKRARKMFWRRPPIRFDTGGDTTTAAAAAIPTAGSQSTSSNCAPLQQADIDETLSEYKGAEERAKKAAADASRLAEELRQEQEHSMHNERLRNVRGGGDSKQRRNTRARILQGLEQQIKEMQRSLDEAEAAALKASRKARPSIYAQISLF